MLIDIYSNKKNQSEFLFLPTSTKIKNIKISGVNISLFTFFKTKDFQPNDESIAVNPSVLIQSINNNGYYIYGVKFIFDEK